jgi:hypothetical protein
MDLKTQGHEDKKNFTSTYLLSPISNISIRVLLDFFAFLRSFLNL